MPTGIPIANIAELGLGILQTYEGFAGLSKLNKDPYKLLTETPEQRASRMRAEEMAKQGFTPQEQAAYEQKMARSQNTGYQRAVDRAPDQSGAILAGINYNDIAGKNAYALNDAQLHRNNISYADSFSKYLQELSNRNIQEQNRRKEEATKQYGMAAQTGLNNIVNPLNLTQALSMFNDNTNPLSGKTAAVPPINTQAPTAPVDQQRMAPIEQMMKLNKPNGYQYSYEGANADDFSQYGLNQNLPR